MSKVLDKFPMGSLAKDVVTGFEGIVNSKTEWFTGCDQVGLRPTELDKDGKLSSDEFFDVSRIKIIAPPTEEIEKVIQGQLQSEEAVQEALTGGPQDRPRQSRG